MEEYIKLSPIILEDALKQVKKFYKENGKKKTEEYGFLLVKGNDGLHSIYFGRDDSEQKKPSFFQWLKRSKRAKP
jgi:hypothetical protein